MTENAPESQSSDRRIFADKAGIEGDALNAFDAWLAALVRWNARVNLVGRSTLDDFWIRHALDSVQVFQCAPNPGRWIDLGAGAGFPGIAVAIMQAQVSSGETCLIESNGKKAAFLREAVRETGAAAQVHAKRWQDMTPERFDVVTARAFAPLPDLLEAAFTFWNEGTIGVFPKGKAWKDEIGAASGDWRFDAQPIPSITGDGAILVVTELRRG